MGVDIPQQNGGVILARSAIHDLVKEPLELFKAFVAGEMAASNPQTLACDQTSELAPTASDTLTPLD